MQVQDLPMSQLAEQLTAHLSDHRSAQLLIVGYSMVPMLRNGRDRVTLVPVERKLVPGDVIFYRRSTDQLVLHRVIRVNGSRFFCCGDHQYSLEEVSSEQILAVMAAFDRAGKRHCVEQPLYRFYARSAVLFFPLRRPYLALRKFAGKLRKGFR